MPVQPITRLDPVARRLTPGYNSAAPRLPWYPGTPLLFLGFRDADNPLVREIVIQNPVLEVGLQFLVEYHRDPGRFDHYIVVVL